MVHKMLEHRILDAIIMVHKMLEHRRVCYHLALKYQQQGQAGTVNCNFYHVAFHWTNFMNKLSRSY